MEKEHEGAIVYVKPDITDLGAMTIVYGRCLAGTVAGGQGLPCSNGLGASGGGTAEDCVSFGSAASCGSGSTPST